MANTKTLSVRVPIDVANNIENLCKQRGITRNALLQECIASEGIVNIKTFEEGGVPKMDKGISNILIGVGGLATGVTIYHILMKNLPESWSKEKKELISSICAVGGGIGMVYGLERATRR